MTVQDLIDLLEQYPAEAEVRLAHQPNWPLAFNVLGVWSAAEDGTDDEEFDADGPGADAVWIVEGEHPHDGSPYAPRDAFEYYRA